MLLGSSCPLVFLGLLACGAGQGGARKNTPAAICPSAPVEVRSSDDLSALRDCTRLAGLTVRSGASLSLSPLSSLTEIDGDLLIGPTLGLDALDLPALQRVGGTLRVAGNSSLSGIFLPALRAAARLELEHNAALTSASLPSLLEISHLTIRDNAELEAVTLTSLERVTELAISNSPQLGLLLMSRLTQVARWEVGPLPSLPADELEALRARAAPPP